ncbi:MAG: AMP-binding protein [Verrucomicrobia bacterium]|nr:AMP-binding protein [Verrucomicrobiota bacterium]
MRIILRSLLKLWFRFRITGADSLSAKGPVLLIPNHASWIDWLFLGAVLEDDWKFVVSSVAAEYSLLHRKLMVNSRTFPIDTNSPYAVKRMAEYLQAGGRLVLFAEGRITNTGSLMKVFDGTGFLLFKTKARVITCYLRGAHRFALSRQPGWRTWFPRVSAHFSPVHQPPELGEVRTSHARAFYTTWLKDRLIEQQFETEMSEGPSTVLAAIVETVSQRPGNEVLEDFQQQPMTGRRLLAGVSVLSEKLEARVAAGPERVGVLLPNLNAMPVVLMSLWSLRKVPAILNFSTGVPTLLTCARLAGFKQVVTSSAFAAKAKLDLTPFREAGIELIELEALRASVGTGDRLAGMVRATFSPRSLCRRSVSPSDAAVVLFTSGSEGIPKGVELTNRNLLANVRQMISVIDLTDQDRIFNALPLFHSFGLTVGTLLGMIRGLYVFLYPSPLHYRVVPTAFYEKNCTVFLATNTFLNGYARKAHPYDFRSMRYLFAGAEKIQETTFLTWARKFGVRILEGYGATECSPCLCVNTNMEPKFGSAGRLLPGVEWKLESFEGVTEGGRLLVRGPNIMKGYVNADANEKFQALGGWYDTGDIVRIDAEGYLHVQGRLKRFAKISGEMVSLTAVEDALAGAFPHHGLRFQVAVVSRPDEDKGEALIAVTNESKLTLEEIRNAIKAKGLTNLCVPREIRVVREIPKLGTGKVNHRELQKELQQSQTSQDPRKEDG